MSVPILGHQKSLKNRVSINTRVAGELGRVSPLQDLQMDRVRDKQAVRWSITWMRSVALRSIESGIDFPHDCFHLIHTVLLGEGIRFHISGPGTVGEGEVEPQLTKPKLLPATLCFQALSLQVQALVDSGAEDNFNDQVIAEKRRLPLEPL